MLNHNAYTHTHNDDITMEKNNIKQEKSKERKQQNTAFT